MAIGRISGQMLKANLLRSGVDLAFETDLLVLDVSNNFVGVGTATPSRQLHIAGTGALRLPGGTSAERGTAAAGDVRYNSDNSTIEGYAGGEWKNLASGTSLKDTDGNTGIDAERTADQNEIHFFTEASGDVAHIRDNGTFEINNLAINDLTISSLTTNGNISISPNGTGSVVIGKADINGGAIDGATIGAASAAAGTFTTGIFADVQSGTVKANDGTTAITIANTTGRVTFGENVIVTGDLTVNGTTTSVNSTTVDITDLNITVAKGAANAAAANGAGITVDGANATMLYVSSSDTWDFNKNVKATFEGNITGALTGNADTVTNGVYTTDTATVTNTMLAGSIANDKLAGSIANDKLSNSAVTIGSTSVSLGATATTIAGLTSVTSTGFTGALTGNADTVTNGVYTTDTSTVTNTMLAGSIANAKLSNSAVTIGSTSLSLGATATTIAGLTSVTSTGFTGNVTGIIDGSGNTTAFNLPVGSTEQRPSAATGVIRFNSTTSTYEGSADGSTWQQFALGTGDVSINKATATGDGSSSTFSGFFSQAPAGANNVMVFIDNVYQEPTENYTVSSTNITFGSAPHPGARIFAMEGFANTAVLTGGVARTLTEAVSFESSATTIMNFNASDYRSAELYVQITDTANGEYSCMKAQVIHDGSTAYIVTYGVLNTSSADTATLTAEYNSGTVNVQAISTGGASTAKVQYSLMAL